MENELFIKAEKLCFSYPGDEDTPAVPVLFDVDFEVKKGEFIAVLGRNGSGKSTFAKLLNMILTPDSGKIYIDGLDITRPDMSEEEIMEVRRRIGMVFQNPDNQLVATIVEEDIAFGPENLGVPSEEIRRRVDKALATVGMTKFARHSPHHLSGGQKQRIAIAGILAMTPECIVFDESTAMLDPSGRREVMNTIEKLNRENGLTVITITHNMDEAVRADRVVIMDHGRVSMSGTPAEVFDHADELIEMGLGVPQATMITHMLRENGADLPYGILDEEDAADAIARLIK